MNLHSAIPHLCRIPADELWSQLGDAGADAGRVARQVVRSKRHNLAVADNFILLEQEQSYMYDIRARWKSKSRNEHRLRQSSTMLMQMSYINDTSLFAVAVVGVDGDDGGVVCADGLAVRPLVLPVHQRQIGLS